MEKYLKKCLTTCFSQNLPPDDYEVLVIDDGSSDGTLALAQRYPEPNLRVFTQENRGLSATRNRGLELAGGDYIWFVDADDWIEDDCLLHLWKLAEAEHPDILAFCCTDIRDDDSEDLGIRRFSYFPPKSDKQQETCTLEQDRLVLVGKDALSHFFVSPCSCMAIYRREFLISKGLRFMEGCLHEDEDFTPRAWFLAERVMLSNDIFYYVRQREGSITRSFNPQRAYDCLRIARSLQDFSRNIEAAYRHPFVDRAALVIIRAYLIACQMDRDGQKAFNAEMAMRLRQHGPDNLLNSLRESSRFKHRLQAGIFSLFPRHSLQAFRLLQLLPHHKYQ